MYKKKVKDEIKRVLHWPLCTDGCNCRHPGDEDCPNCNEKSNEDCPDRAEDQTEESGGSHRLNSLKNKISSETHRVRRHQSAFAKGREKIQ